MSRRRMQCTINVDSLVMWVEEVFPLPGCVYLTKLGKHTITVRQLQQLPRDLSLTSYPIILKRRSSA